MTSKYKNMQKAMLSLHISKDWEEVPDEDLWEDGQLGFKEVERKIIEHLQIIGDWKLIRRKDGKRKTYL